MSTADTQEARTVSSEVSVGVPAQTAFSVFTDEIDLWWVRGPINFYDGARAIGMRCEPGVGGRLLELYSEDATDALELGRITDWQPGSRLAWTSSVDDVEVEVRFEPVPAGTRVTVSATVPPGGTDTGGSAWVRVTPGWLGAWCERRDTAPRVPTDMARLALALYYAQPAAAAHWLVDAFGLVTELDLPANDNHRGWIELRSANCSFIIFPLKRERREGQAVTHVPWLFVDDLDAHCEHARGRGATILTGIRQDGYRCYEAEDLEGNKWVFAQARPTM
jgi:uncharacterized glyoxalase superfamily protein PhnB